MVKPLDKTKSYLLYSPALVTGFVRHAESSSQLIYQHSLLYRPHLICKWPIIVEYMGHWRIVGYTIERPESVITYGITRLLPW